LPCPSSSNNTSKTALQQRRQSQMQNIDGLNA
jgi:hypothetical protein